LSERIEREYIEIARKWSYEFLMESPNSPWKFIYLIGPGWRKSSF